MVDTANVGAPRQAGRSVTDDAVQHPWLAVGRGSFRAAPMAYSRAAMGRFSDYDAHDGLGLADLVRRGEVSPGELIEEAIARIEQVNPWLQAVIRPMYGGARTAAKDAHCVQGAFAGVPFLVKDLGQTVAGTPTLAGCRFYRGAIAEYDSELIGRYRAAGLVLVAKTNTPELGLVPITEPEMFGPTRNPWNTERTPGGSSGGSAAAVAARVVPMAHGNDGGGSVRIPASCCGLFGLKPTRARNPVGPDASEHWNGFVQDHVLTRSVRDSAAMLDATAGPEPVSPYVAPVPERSFLDETRRPPGQLRIAYHAEPAMPTVVHADCVAAVEDAARLCEELGHVVEHIPPSHDAEALARSFATLVCGHTAAEITEAEQRLDRRAKAAEFETATWLGAMRGRLLTAEDMSLALRHLQAESRRLVFHYDEAGWDVVLTPSVGQPPAAIGALQPGAAEAKLQDVVASIHWKAPLRMPRAVERTIRRMYGLGAFTPVANFTGRPSMSVPLYWNDEGLPIGALFTAPLGGEATLFRLAAQLEQARPWKPHYPPLHAS